MPHGRRRVRFLVQAGALLGLACMAAYVLVTLGDELSTVQRLIVWIALFMMVQGLANTISVPVVDPRSFTVRYGPLRRTIRPENVTSVTYQPLTRTFTIRERWTPFGYRLAPSDFVDPEGISRAVRTWAENNSVRVHG